MSVFRDLRHFAETIVRRTWMKHAMRGVGQADAHRRLEFAYKLRDPWKLDSPQEHFRFAESNRILHRALIAPAARVGSLLEIGSGEGHQTEYLAKLCERISGIDVSPTAISRARQRHPSATLYVGDLREQPWARERGRYDIVTAFEVLYFLSDIPRMLDTMSHLGRACAVSYFGPSAGVVEPALRAIPNLERESFSFGDVEWHMAWWRS